ncbi:hypothetical protein GN244_ATG16913 [Phytophthora infestans]|uniref:Uncharacterized protein n=1 Tax=Phytophthora infestans TaxID=4787 RepID=A0A833SI13_PHYIN|nr:hypothetical protein GN244_ATG16913 [Phytophthora infestans]
MECKPHTPQRPSDCFDPRRFMVNWTAQQHRKEAFTVLQLRLLCHRHSCGEWTLPFRSLRFAAAPLEWGSSFCNWPRIAGELTNLSSFLTQTRLVDRR